jgi:hypothetical protein
MIPIDKDGPLSPFLLLLIFVSMAATGGEIFNTGL